MGRQWLLGQIRAIKLCESAMWSWTMLLWMFVLFVSWVTRAEATCKLVLHRSGDSDYTITEETPKKFGVNMKATKVSVIGHCCWNMYEHVKTDRGPHQSLTKRGKYPVTLKRKMIGSVYKKPCPIKRSNTVLLAVLVTLGVVLLLTVV